MTSHTVLIDELEGALRGGLPDRGTRMVRQIAALLLDDGASYSAEQLDLFDQVLSRLADGIEATARAELAEKLCDARVAPVRLLRRLALDETLPVAAPLLARSERIDDAILIECVQTRGQGHLLAISRRRAISPSVTDQLVTHGESEVLLAVSQNAGARFSESGFAILVQRAEGNDALASSVGIRADLPRHQFLRMLSTASEIVRERLEAANPQSAKDIRTVVASVTESIAARVAPERLDFANATRRALALKASGSLGDRELLQYLAEKRLDAAIASVAVLAELDATAVEQALHQKRPEALLMILKAVGLGWPTAKAFLQVRAGADELALGEVDRALSSFARLSVETAQQALQLRRKAD